jgi:pyrroloquinoline quinone (PQQ) biosynthesis protein C
MPSQEEQLLKLYDELPFERHPLWQQVLKGALSMEQVLQAEEQHFLRTKNGQRVRADAVRRARSQKVFGAILETYLEECTDKHGPNHLDLIARLLVAGGRNRAALDSVTPTPGNAAAIALYRDIGARGAACHLLGAGAVEHFYSLLAPRIFKAYTERYGMSPDAAETYRLHGPMDRKHADRAFSILDEAVQLHGWNLVRLSVRDAFVATSLHYDGMLQAATGMVSYWNGRT